MTKERRGTPSHVVASMPEEGVESKRSPRVRVVDDLAWLALESAAEGIFIVNGAGEFVYLNGLARRWVGAVDGIEMGAVSSEPFELYRLDGVTKLVDDEAPISRALKGEALRGLEAVFKSEALPEGFRVAVTANVIVDGSGEQHGAVLVVHDETDNLRVRKALEQRELYLHAILDNLPDIAWLKDANGAIVAVNEPMARASRLSAEELIGKTDFDLYPLDLAERYRVDDQHVMKTRSTLRLEEPFAVADGTRVTVETIKTAVVDEHGNVIGTTGIARDISARKHAEEELRQSKNELERRIEERTRELERAQELSVRKERLAVLGQLAGGVAHQIRNPLAAIKNSGYVLERALPQAGIALPPLDGQSVRRSSPSFGERGPDGVLRLTPEQQIAQSLVIIHEEIRRANDIISGLLDYARIRAPVRQVVSARELVMQVLAAAEIPETVAVTSALGSSAIAVDPSQVQEALHVLLRNAVDAMPDGGKMMVASREDGPWVVLGIEDSGVGVPPDIAPRLFEPLLTTKPMGLGLGLVTARTLVEAQGGQLVHVPSSPPGARFEMRLPRG